MEDLIIKYEEKHKKISDYDEISAYNDKLYALEKELSKIKFNYDLYFDTNNIILK